MGSNVGSSFWIILQRMSAVSSVAPAAASASNRVPAVLRAIRIPSATRRTFARRWTLSVRAFASGRPLTVFTRASARPFAVARSPWSLAA